MRSWIAKVREHRAAILDGLAVLALSVALCGLLAGFCIIRLSARDWWPMRYGLSEDGSIYVSLCAGGLRAHDVETGKEIDRITLRAPWRDFTKPPENGLFRLHPLDEANAESFHHGEWLSDDGEGYWDTRPRMQVSPSRRYVVAVFPSGYLLLWDRQRDRAQLLEAAEYFLRTVSFDEAKQVLIVESKLRPEHLPENQRDMQANTINAGLPVAISVLTYRLDSFKLDSKTVVPDAGEPFNGDRNCRSVDDRERKEIRITKWSDFPQGSPQIVHRIPYSEFPDAENDPWRYTVRMVESHLSLVTIDNSHVSFRLYPGEHSTHRSQLPWSMQECSLDWLANGSASFVDGARSEYTIATWGVDGLLVAYGFPDDYTAIAALPCPPNDRFLRVAGEEGRIIDLPIGRSGEFRSRQLDLTAFPFLPYQFTAIVSAFGLCWCVRAWQHKSLFARRGWLILGLLAIWLVIFWGIELQMARAPYGFLVCSILWLALGIIAATSGVTGFLNGDPTRSGVVCLCALFAMLLLGEIPSRQASDRGRVAKEFHGTNF